MKSKKWTPVDNFVIEYGFRHDQTFTYQPGSGKATMKTGPIMDLDDLRALIKSVEHHELQIMISGEITVFQPEEPGEEAEAPEEENVEKCPECGGPATHPSGLCRECHQAKLEAPDEEEIAEAVEPDEDVCPDCKGTGVFSEMGEPPYDAEPVINTCETCKGTGKIDKVEVLIPE